MRLFIALELPDEICNEVALSRADLEKICEYGNFSHQENYHITLAFIGETHPKNTGRIQKILDALDFPAADLVTGGLSRFSRDGGDTVFREVSCPASLENLQRELTGRLNDAGFDIAKQKFRAHITLAREVRLKKGTRYSDVMCREKTFRGDSVALMLSERKNGRLVYTCLYRVKLH